MARTGDFGGRLIAEIFMFYSFPIKDSDPSGPREKHGPTYFDNLLLSFAPIRGFQNPRARCHALCALLALSLNAFGRFSAEISMFYGQDTNFPNS